MPRRERVARTQKSMVASGARYQSKRPEDRAEKRARGGEEWQRAGWDFYDLIGEYRQAPAIKGALLSRAKLTVLENGEPTKNPIALAALAELCGGPEGQAEMMRQWGIHSSVAGEFFIVAPKDSEIHDADAWIYAATTKVTSTVGGAWKVEGDELTGNRMIIRVWAPHPASRKKADAPTRAALPTLSELLQLRKRIAAQIDSRLSGGGVWFLPSETDFPTQPVRQLNVGDPAITRDSIQGGSAQGLVDMLVDQGSIAINDQTSPEAMFPLIATVPGEHLDKIKDPITFWSELDKAAPKMRAELMESLARSMDVPPEVLLGAAGSNHWNAWLSDENNVKIHGEPLLKILINALTTKYLRPALSGLVDDAAVFSFGVDTSQMRLRPNRSKEALELNDRFILSDEATLRENGFTEADLMSEEQLRKALLRRMATGSATPELVALANRLLGVELPEIKDNRPPTEARPTPSLTEHPTRELPKAIAASVVVAETAPGVSQGLVFASEQLIDRALQRAGNRIKTKMGLRDPAAPANRLYTVSRPTADDVSDLLQDAWSTVGDFDYGVDPALLRRALDLYTRSLLVSGREPSRAGIAATLSLMLSRSAH